MQFFIFTNDFPLFVTNNVLFLSHVAATTISFSFVGPTDTGGIRIKAYAVQYKEMSQTWNEARNKSWPVGKRLSNFNFVSQSSVHGRVVHKVVTTH